MTALFRLGGVAFLVSGALILLLLSGCAVGPDFVPPEAPSINHYNRGGDPGQTAAVNGVSQRFDRNPGPSAEWWRLFQSRQLDSLVTRGLEENPGLEAAQASLRQSQENLRAGSGIFYPQLGATFTHTREKSSSGVTGTSLPGNIFNLTTLSASVNYTLDVFGGQRRAVEGLSAQVDQQRALTLGTYMILSGNIVNTAFAIAAYRAELDEVEQLIALEKDQAGIADKQYQAGLTVYASVLALRNQLDALEATLPPIRQKLIQSEHLLATLLGKTPAEWEPPTIMLYDIPIPDRLPLTLPSELVRRRPDILAAEAQMHQASAAIGVATAAMFPGFTLNSSYGRTSSVMNSLLDQKNSIWGLGASVTASLLDGGTLASKRRAAIDAYKQSEANYRQTVLAAFAQVADVIRALEHDAELAQIEAQAIKDTRLSLDLVQANYKTGLVNYLQVILADIQYHQARLGYLQARTQQLQDTTALFIALGGGWPDDARARKAAGLEPVK
jgi:NodT family efflux transporter outer membrane factor (OMF) lipoprotein